MKKFNTILNILFCLISISGFAQTNIHYWDFTAGDGPGPNKWPSPVVATVTVNAGTLTHNFTATENFGGSTLDFMGFVTPANTKSFCPVGLANNGNALILNVSTVGFTDIILSYATQGSGTGFTTQTVDYSIDGMNFINITSFPNTNVAPFVLKTIDFTAIPGVNNNPDFKVRITVAG